MNILTPPARWSFFVLGLYCMAGFGIGNLENLGKLSKLGSLEILQQNPIITNLTIIPNLTKFPKLPNNFEF